MGAIDDIETPAVLIDIDRVEANLARAQTYADEHGLTLRPHIKTHKLPQFAKRQIALGAAGITCQKLGEAEVMADAGIDDIFLPYNILGATKLQRLVALSRRIRLSVTADSRETIDGYSSAFANDPQPLEVLVECDTGMKRCGVPTPAEAVKLARAIDAAPGLLFGGLMTYPPHGRVAEVASWLEEAVEALNAAGLPAKAVSTGGTPDFWSAHEVKAATEHRPGTYIYFDRSLVACGAGTMDDCALTVLTMVVSAPTRDRVVLDAGSKSLTSDTLGMTGFGHLVAYPKAVITSLSEEHGVVDVSRCAEPPRIGERVRIVPNHACVVSNLFDRVNLISDDRLIETVAVAARGRVD